MGGGGRMRCGLLISVLAILCGCVTPAQRALLYAQQHGMTASMIQGTRFHHQVFTRAPGAPELPSSAAAAAMLYVFIEGDGLPWSDAGSKVARDPTPHRPLALELAAATPHSVLYLGRPCYFAARSDANCTPDFWTSGRYSHEVIDSMVAAVHRYASANNDPSVILIGYSGGGALAVLMAAQLSNTRAVITIAANLDVDAWARWHRYLPLYASANPATNPPLTNSIQQRHLVGGKDDNVPEALDQLYFNIIRSDEIWRYPDFDHVCCWTAQWTSILARIDGAVAANVDSKDHFESR